MKDSDRMKNALLLLLWACAAFAFGDDDADLQARIDAARARLDDAARELAQLHKQDTFQIELPNPEHRVSLGVLLSPGGKRGVTIAGVTPDGAAAEAGIRAGDVIVAVNGISLRDAGSKPPMARLFDALKEVSPGDVIHADYERNGDLQSVDVTARDPVPERVPQPVAGFAMSTMAFNGGPGAPPTFAARAMIGGLELFQLNEDLGHYFGVSDGVLILSAPPDKDGGGPVAGDVVRGVDGKPVTSLADSHQRGRRPQRRRADRSATRRRGGDGAHAQRSLSAGRHAADDSGPRGRRHPDEHRHEGHSRRSRRDREHSRRRVSGWIRPEHYIRDAPGLKANDCGQSHGRSTSTPPCVAVCTSCSAARRIFACA